jgi:hypothetical protein
LARDTAGVAWLKVTVSAWLSAHPSALSVEGTALRSKRCSSDSTLAGRLHDDDRTLFSRFMLPTFSEAMRAGEPAHLRLASMPQHRRRCQILSKCLEASNRA